MSWQGRLAVGGLILDPRLSAMRTPPLRMAEKAMDKITRQEAGLKAFNYPNSPLRDESRSFPKAEGFNPQGCSCFLYGL
jgi:hypothetical protein